LIHCKAERILPHRSYRKLHRAKGGFFVEIVLYAVFAVWVVYMYLTQWLNTFSLYFAHLLNEVSVTATTKIDTIYDRFPIVLIDLSFVHMQPLYLYLFLMASVLLFYLLKHQKLIVYNVAMWMNFFVLMLIVFLIYFIFMGDTFPYTFADYVELYITALVGFMLFSFLITFSAIALIPGLPLFKIFAIVSMAFYYIIYTFARYALTILLSSQISILFAPVMFFTLFFDFIFFVSIYSYVLYKSAKRKKEKEFEWRW